MYVARTLPKRFWTREEYQEGEERFSRVICLKSEDFRKLYTKEINPLLKKEGFSCQGFIASKTIEDKNLQLMINFGADKYGGTGYFSFAFQPTFLPCKSNFAWEFSKAKIYQFRFLHDFRLANGNNAIDMGKNEEEGLESLALMKECFIQQFPEKLASALEFPGEFEEMNPSQLVQNKALFVKKYGARFIESREEVSLLLLMAQYFMHKGNKAKAHLLANFGILKDIEMAATDAYFPHPNEVMQQRLKKILAL